MTRLKAWLASILAALAGLLAVWGHGRRRGATDERTRGLEDAAKRTEAGRQAVQRGRDSGADPAQRLRDNDGRW